VIWGPDRRLKFSNRALAEVFRLDESRLADEILHDEVLEMLREERMIPEQADFQAYKRRFRDMYTTLTEPVEELIHLPDGRSLRVSRSPHPLGGLLFSYEDVSGQLELERSRNTLAAVQQTTLDNLTQAVAVFGGDGRLKLWNRTYAELWGFSDELLAGEPHLAELYERAMPIVSIFSDGVPDGIEALVEWSLDRTARLSRIERTDGLILDSATVPLPDGATLITLYDVTDSTRVERALRERTETLEEADALKSQFIANVSYELRTPLNTITGFSEFLIDQFFGELNARQLEYVEGIFESSGYLLALINDILDLATIEAGRMRIEHESFDITSMAQSAMRLVEERAREKSLTMRMEVPPDIGSMEADERRIRQVIFNLLNNAIRLSDRGGTVTLGASRDDEAIAIWVSDTGQGLAPEDVGRAFDPFRRGDEGHNNQPGSSLGLALVERFVALHGGRVALVSVLGQGSRVTCTIPDRTAKRLRRAAAEA
jgi:signal transduction histidine kinase